MLSFNWSVSLCLALHLIQYVSARSSAKAGWTAPPASAGDFAEQYTNGDNITLSWKALNHSTADLWVTAYDPTTDGFAKFLTGAIDLRVPGAFRWNIAIAGVILSADGRFVLRFVSHGEIYYPGMTHQIPSPAFTVKTRPRDEPLSTSSSSTESSTTTDSSTSTSTTTASEPTVAGAGLTTGPGGIAATPTPTIAAATSSHNDNNSLSDGSIAGITIGSAAVLAMFLGLGILIGTRRRRHVMGRLDEEKNVPPGTSINLHEHAINRHMSILTSPSAFAAPSTYAHAREFQGNAKQPVELDTRPADGQGRARDSRNVGAGAGGGTDQELETPTLSNPSNSGTFSPTSPPRKGDSPLR